MVNEELVEIQHEIQRVRNETAQLITNDEYTQDPVHTAKIHEMGHKLDELEKDAVDLHDRFLSFNGEYIILLFFQFFLLSFYQCFHFNFFRFWLRQSLNNLLTKQRSASTSKREIYVTKSTSAFRSMNANLSAANSMLIFSNWIFFFQTKHQQRIAR